MKDLINDKLLLRFLKKETSPEENDEIKQWVLNSEANREKLHQLHETFHLSMFRHYQSEIDMEQAWIKLYGQLPKAKSRMGYLRMGNFWKIAASVAIILGIGFGSLWTNKNYFQNPFRTKISIESPSGEKSKVILADGTHVWLNSQTTLDYDAADPRKVTLHGEAYFNVTKDRAHPFEVTTASGLKVTVLGTRFNLRSFSGEDQVEATLEEGEIVISGIYPDHPVRLEPGQQADYNTSDHQLKIRNVSAEIYSLWKNNELRFSDITFRDLVPRIERWYGVKIKLDPQISTTDRFTMTIKTESLRELLNMMQLTSNFNYGINGEEVEIKAN